MINKTVMTLAQLLLLLLLCFKLGAQENATPSTPSQAPQGFNLEKSTTSCFSGKSNSCYQIGQYFEQLKNEPKAIEFYDRACRDKHKMGCLRFECKTGIYASCYFLGIEAEKKQKPELAKKYFKRACDGEIAAGCDKLVESSTPMLLYVVAMLLIGGAVIIVALSMFQDESQFRASAQLEEGGEKVNLAEKGVVLKYSRPFFKRYISPIVGQMKAKKQIREKYKRPLYSAGLSELMTPDDFFSFKIFLIIGFPVLFLAIRAFLEADWPLIYVPAISVLGYFYPDIWIKGTIQRRQQLILRAMPFAVDMLALSVEAGLDFVAAMQKVIEKAKRSPLVDEFEMMIKETKVGASRAEALRNMAWRIDTIEIASFCATLIAADSVGASIGPILKNLSTDIRQKKSADVEKQGAKATTKILIPMIFFIVPAVLLMIAAPLVSDFTGRK